MGKVTLQTLTYTPESIWLLGRRYGTAVRLREWQYLTPGAGALVKYTRACVRHFCTSQFCLWF